MANLDYIPQAIINKPIEFFSREIGIGCDDLDEYKEVPILLNKDRIFGYWRTYRGHDQNTTTLYLHDGIKSTDLMTIDFVLASLGIIGGFEVSDVKWRRSDDPDL